MDSGLYNQIGLDLRMYSLRSGQKIEDLFRPDRLLKKIIIIFIEETFS